MIRFRPFQNCDPPGLVRIWNAQSTHRYLLARLTEPLLDQFVLSKLYFDPAGLIVADDGQNLRGFVHAGFGPANGESAPAKSLHAAGSETTVGPNSPSEPSQQGEPSLSDNDGHDTSETRPGCICLAYAVDGRSDPSLTRELCQRAEEYLREKGADTCFGGAHGRVAPFYLGLYGGSELPGIVESDEHHTQLFLDGGYTPQRRNQIWRINLPGFRAPMSRELLQIRRQFGVELAPPVHPKDWWEACQMAHHEQAEFRLLPLNGTQHVASLIVWDLEPLASGWGSSAVGLTNWQLPDGPSGQAYELYLLCEVIKQLQVQGVALMETQVSDDDTWAQSVLTELGFQQVDVGVVYQKL